MRSIFPHFKAETWNPDMKSLLVHCFLWSVVAMLTTGCAMSGSTAQQKPADFGVLVMAHGGSKDWNRAVRAAVTPLESRYPIDLAFGMADPKSLQESVQRLEKQGAHRIAVVRLFVSGESFKDRTEQILGIAPGAPPKPSHEQHAGHDMSLWRISTQSAFAMSDDGLLDSPEMGVVLAERAGALSHNPATEDVLILAHGPGEDDENARWLAKLNARAEAVRRSKPFRRVSVETLREDWPDKRVAAEQRIRSFVERAKTEQGTAIVLPFRVQGFGPYAEVLASLDYVSDGVGLLPDPKVTDWIERQAQVLRAGQFRKPLASTQ